MKKSIILFVLLIANTAFAQYNYGSQNILYSAPNASPNTVIIGASTVQGTYGATDRVLEIVSPLNSSSFITFKSGLKAMSFGCGPYGNGIYIPSNETFFFSYGATQVMKINPTSAGNPTGSLSIGTTLAPSGYRLAVGGKIIAEELKVQLQAQWPDYVFSKYYNLPTLAEVEKQILEKGHLANMPSAEEVNCEGFEVGELTRLQQEKIEELTLYIIELNKKLEAQEKRMQQLEAKVGN